MTEYSPIFLAVVSILSGMFSYKCAKEGKTLKLTIGYLLVMFGILITFTILFDTFVFPEIEKLLK